MNNQNLKGKELQKISQRYENLTSQREELEKLRVKISEIVEPYLFFNTYVVKVSKKCITYSFF